MSDTYHHEKMRETMWQPRILDQFVTSANRTFEHVVSMFVDTSCDGYTHYAVALDLVASSDVVIHREILARYVHFTHDQVEEDAIRAAKSFHVDCRKSTLEHGWFSAFIMDRYPEEDPMPQPSEN